MRSILAQAQIGIVSVRAAAFSLPLLAPVPAAAWGYHHGWRWRAGNGWHPDWAYSWHQGCCYGPGSILGVRRSVIYLPPPIVMGPVWVKPYWHRSYWIPGHWR